MYRVVRNDVQVEMYIVQNAVWRLRVIYYIYYIYLGVFTILINIEVEYKDYLYTHIT